MKPGPVLVISTLLLLLLASAVYFVPFLFIIWLYAVFALVLISAIDFVVLRFLTDNFEIKREISSSLSQGRNTKVKLLITRRGEQKILFLPFRIKIFDMHPLSMESSCFPASLNGRVFKKSNFFYFEYSIVPVQRGPWNFFGTEILLSSPLNFWNRKVFQKCISRGKTYPDFNKIKASSDLRFLLEKTGVKNIRRRGQGMEFKGLRDYQEGDSLRDIDWRAVSRRRNIDSSLKLIVREYQEEQDQQVLLLLDTGYRLHRSESTAQNFIRTQFDSALEAVLLLSWVSLKHGDSVAAASFGTTSRWILPCKGMSAFPRLMNGLYDLKSSAAPSSPFSCLEESLSRLKRRTFIILVSNFREEDGESLSWILKRIEKRHLLLLVSLKENESENLAERYPKTQDEALETAAAFSYLVSRRELYQSWEHQGILTLEASSKTLSPALINRYLRVKRSGRL